MDSRFTAIRVRSLGWLLMLFVAALGCGGGPPETELIRAARQGEIATIQALLGRGADPDQLGGVNGWTPLMHAIHNNQRAAVNALLDGGADVDAQTSSGVSALIMAAGYGQSVIVRDLLARGADPYLESSNGHNALAAAVGGVSDIDRFTLGHCQTDTVAALTAAAPDLELRDNLSTATALWVARAGGCSEVLTLGDR